jgi:hypothetical protein
MPFFTSLDQEDENKDQAAGGGAGGEVKISGASPTTDSSGAAASSQGGGGATHNKQLNTGSGFQNLDKYLKTNQSQQFGQQVLGKVQGDVENAQKNMTQAGDQFKNTVQGANHLASEDDLNKSLSDPSNADAKQFQDWRNESYTGPKSLAESQDAWNKYWSGSNQASANAKALGTESGRFGLLDNYFGRPQYNFGQKSLDNLLVQQSGLGQQTRDVQNQAAGLKSQGQQQAQQLQNFAAQRAGEVEQNKNHVNEAYQGAVGQAQDSVNQTLSQAQDQRAQEQNALKQAIGTGKFNPDQMRALGLSSGQSLYNTDLNNYFKFNDSPLSKEQVATDDQRARLNALAQLGGDTQSFLGDHIDPSQSYSFDSNRFKQDVAGQDKSYMDERNRILADAQRQADNIRLQLMNGRNTNMFIDGQTYSNQQLVDHFLQKGQQDVDALGQRYNVGRIL